MSPACDSPESSCSSSSSKLRICTSAPNSRASIVAVSVSSVELIVIINRLFSSFARTSFTRTSSLSARSFTVMPSASVIVRVTGGGAAGIDGGATDRTTWSRRAPGAGRVGENGRIGGRGGCDGRGGMPGRGAAPGCVRTGCDGSGRGPPGV